MAIKVARIQTADGRVARIQVKVSETDQGLISKGFETLKKPEEMSRSGLSQITNILTPSRENIEAGKVGVPGIVARTAGETLSEVAPSFISRGALTTAGALKGTKLAVPAIKAVGKFSSRGWEELTGQAYRNKGILAETFNKPSLFYSFAGKKLEKAKDIYTSIKKEIGDFSLFKGDYEPKKIIDKAQEFTERGGKLDPAESLIVRRAIDKLIGKEGYVKEELMKMRKFYDDIAKTNSRVVEADVLFMQGKKGEALKKLFPTNKGGTPSIFKVGIGGATLGTLALPMSPVIAGGTAATLGVGAKALKPLLKTPVRVGAMGGGLRFPTLSSQENK